MPTVYIDYVLLVAWAFIIGTFIRMVGVRLVHDRVHIRR
jgi:hypothetical protein